MNFQKKIATLATVIFACTLTTGFGLKDVTKGLKPDMEKCEKKEKKQKCQDKEKLKTAVKVVAIGLAAKAIHDMVIEYRTKKLADENTVKNAYLKKHKELPDEPEVVSYTTSLKPGQVVKPGKPVLLVSKVEVVPGKKQGPIKVSEKIDIHDNEKPENVIQTLTKGVNEKTPEAGLYENEFSFTLPEGMPQGVYPIATAIIINGKPLNHIKNDMQVVLNVDAQGTYQVALAQ